jgi:hypothetical protein
MHRKFQSLAPARMRVRVFCSGLYPEVPVGAVCVHVHVRENCSGFCSEVPVRTGSSGPGTGSSGGPELTNKPNGLISFDRKFRWLPPELPMAHLGLSI